MTKVKIGVPGSDVDYDICSQCDQPGYRLRPNDPLPYTLHEWLEDHEGEPVCRHCIYGEKAEKEYLQYVKSIQTGNTFATETKASWRRT